MYHLKVPNKRENLEVSTAYAQSYSPVGTYTLWYIFKMLEVQAHGAMFKQYKYITSKMEAAASSWILFLLNRNAHVWIYTITYMHTHTLVVYINERMKTTVWRKYKEFLSLDNHMEVRIQGLQQDSFSVSHLHLPSSSAQASSCACASCSPDPEDFLMCWKRQLSEFAYLHLFQIENKISILPQAGECKGKSNS